MIPSVQKSFFIEENEKNLRECQKYGYKYILIDKEYQLDILF